MNHIFGCPMHYGVGAPGLINSLDYLQSFCPELDIHILPEITRPEENLSNLKHLNSVIASCSQIAESGYHAKVNHHFTLPAITVPPSEVSLLPEPIAKILV